MAERSLHIGVDARELMGHPTGVGRYLMGVLGAWAADRAFLHRVTLFLPGELQRGHAFAAPHARVTTVVVRAGAAGTWWEQTQLPSAAARAGVDVLFSPGYTAPIRLRMPSVVAIHDLSYFAHPEWFGWREGLRRRWLTRASARRARAIVTISEFSAGELVRWTGVPRGRIHLAPPGSPAASPHVTDAARAPMVLFVGSLFNRRRIPELLQGFARAAARVPDARLVLVGDNRTNPPLDPRALAASLGIADRVEWREYVEDAALDRLYATASVFAFLSDYEGFAMTPLEALAHGVPSVLLDTAVAREVYGDTARFVPPDPAAIGAALIDLLTDAAARQRALTGASARLAAYSWPRSAAIVREVLERAVVTP